ncbi:MAG: stage II sporulation protein P [Christensenellales bacterium]
MLKRNIIVVALLLISVLSLIKSPKISNAEVTIFSPDTQIYSIYDENFELLFQKDLVVVGDGYLSEDFKYYEVVYLDEETKKGLAKFVRYVTPPKVKISNEPKPIKIEDRVICMYMTHNDESYVPSDGVDSIYGNGGIKDVAMAFKSELEKYFIDVHLDDTLHIPHDTSAYTRSSKTAKSLISTYNPDAIFDIHRDATSRSFYVTKINGKERGRVRMVIGKANSNMALNEEFALYIMSVANELYPWLFTDIYYASGHYNQGLDSKAILFEMGSHLVEKELEIESMRELADVITTALYNTTVNSETGDLTINGTESSDNLTVNDYMDEQESSKINVIGLVISLIALAGASIYATFMFFKNIKKLTTQKENSDK